jgi:hypothetical protein
MPGHGAQPAYPQVGMPQTMGGSGFFPAQQAGPQMGQPMHAQHPQGLQLAQPGAPLQLSQTRSQPRAALSMGQPAMQQHAPMPMPKARPAPAQAPRAPQRAAPAQPKARPAQPKAAQASEPKKRGKLTPVLVVAGAGVGAVLAWVLMNVL